MNKIIILITFSFFINGCSLNKNSKFWTAEQKISEENKQNFEKVLIEEEALNQELNSNLIIKFDRKINDNLILRNYSNNDGRLNYDGILKKSSRYKFSKIKNFYQFEPTISFDKKDIISVFNGRKEYEVLVNPLDVRNKKLKCLHDLDFSKWMKDWNVKKSICERSWSI